MQTPTTETIAFDRWRELGADGVVKGTVKRTGNTFQVEMRLFNVRARAVALGRVYDNVALRNPRAVAHTMSDEIHQTQASLRGVARTKLTFVSDRDNERVIDTVETRTGKEVYVSDYDGANQMRVTVEPPAEHHAVMVARRPEHRVHVVSRASSRRSSCRTSIRDARDADRREIGRATCSVFSPDGTRIAFMSQRDGNSEIYVMNRERLGRAPADEQLRRPTRRRRGRRPERRSRLRPTGRGRRRSG